MPDIVLTSEADLLACELYSEYISRREEGVPKASAKKFRSDDVIALVPRWTRNDAQETLRELMRAFPPQQTEIRSVFISDAFIVYMEGRFGRKADKVLKRVAEIKNILF